MNYVYDENDTCFVISDRLISFYSIQTADGEPGICFDYGIHGLEKIARFKSKGYRNSVLEIVKDMITKL